MQSYSDSCPTDRQIFRGRPQRMRIINDIQYGFSVLEYSDSKH